MGVIFKPSGVCPNGQCVVELERVGSGYRTDVAKGMVSICGHHRSVKASLGLTDLQVHLALLASSARRETARWRVKVELGLAEMPPYRLNPNGSFTILTGTTGTALTALRSSVASAISSIDSSGAGLVEVE